MSDGLSTETHDDCLDITAGASIPPGSWRHTP